MLFEFIYGYVLHPLPSTAIDHHHHVAGACADHGCSPSVPSRHWVGGRMTIAVAEGCARVRVATGGSLSAHRRSTRARSRASTLREDACWGTEACIARACIALRFRCMFHATRVCVATAGGLATQRRSTRARRARSAWTRASTRKRASRARASPACIVRFLMLRFGRVLHATRVRVHRHDRLPGRVLQEAPSAE